MRIAIIGYSGSGKSTLAKHLGEKYNIPTLYLDKVQFLSNWVVRNQDESYNIVTEFLNDNENWVIDGTYTNFLLDKRLALADKIIFMNFYRINCFLRAYKRFLSHKNQSRESISQGCIEKMDLEFINWLLIEGRSKKHRLQFKQILEEYNEKCIVVKNQRQLDKLYKTKL